MKTLLKFAAQIEEGDNMYIHFNLDPHSWSSQRKFDAIPKNFKKYFYS